MQVSMRKGTVWLEIAHIWRTMRIIQKTEFTAQTSKAGAILAGTNGSVLLFRREVRELLDFCQAVPRNYCARKSETDGEISRQSGVPIQIY
jgi:hypothetical protein